MNFVQPTRKTFALFHYLSGWAERAVDSRNPILLRWPSGADLMVFCDRLIATAEIDGGMIEIQSDRFAFSDESFFWCRIYGCRVLAFDSPECVTSKMVWNPALGFFRRKPHENLPGVPISLKTFVRFRVIGSFEAFEEREVVARNPAILQWPTPAHLAVFFDRVMGATEIEGEGMKLYSKPLNISQSFENPGIQEQFAVTQPIQPGPRRRR